MRRWLVEETGELRCPKKGEYFYWEEGRQIAKAHFDFDSYVRPILIVTELKENLDLWVLQTSVPDIPLIDRFDEWNW